MNNDTRQQMVKARDALEVVIEAFGNLARRPHTGLRGEMQDDFLSMAADLQRNELRQLVLTAQAMGEPAYDVTNTSISYDAWDRQTVLWYHHKHPDDGELIYQRIATKHSNGKFTISQDYPAITSKMASDLIHYHTVKE